VEDRDLDMTVQGMEEGNHTGEEDTEPPLQWINQRLMHIQR
jgi:hypothetical protein